MQFRNVIASLAVASTILATPIDLNRREEGSCPGFKQIVQTVWEKNSEGAAPTTSAKNAPATASKTAAPVVTSAAGGNQGTTNSDSEQDSSESHSQSDSQSDSQSNSQSDSQSDSQDESQDEFQDESESNDETSSADAQPSTSVSTSAASSTILQTTTINGSPSVITSIALETQFITITFTPSQSAAPETSSSGSADPSSQNEAEAASTVTVTGQTQAGAASTVTVRRTKVVTEKVTTSITSTITDASNSVGLTTIESVLTKTILSTADAVAGSASKTDSSSASASTSAKDQDKIGTAKTQADSTSVVTVTRSTFVPVSTILEQGSFSIVQTLIPATFTTTVVVTETPETKADAAAGSASTSESSSASASASAGGYGSMPQGSSDSNSDSNDDNSDDNSDSSDDSSDSSSDSQQTPTSSADAAATTAATTLVIDNTLTVTQSLGAITTQGPTSAPDASTVSDVFTSEAPTSLAAQPTGQPHRDINDPNYQNAWVNAHNAKRDLHGVPHVQWSDDLAKSALIIGENCIFQHNQTVGGGGYGQNINAVTGANDSPEGATNGWYSEEPKFRNEYDQASPASSFHDWGHFTQVVWKSTTEIGCATVTCKNGLALAWPDKESDFTVCNYRVAGNVGGQYADNVPRPH